MKEEIKDALKSADFEKIAQLALAHRKVFRILISLTYDKEDLLCWRAIEAMGKAAGAVSGKDPQAVRNIVQRLIWSLSEESGGIGWSAPEMLGEIVISNPQACSDIPPIILSFHEEESFLKGVLWAMGRIAGSGMSSVEGAYEVALRSLEDKDPSVRGLALYALLKGRISQAVEKVREMVDDEGRFRIYEDGELREVVVGDVAKKVLADSEMHGE